MAVMTSIRRSTSIGMEIALIANTTAARKRADHEIRDDEAEVIARQEHRADKRLHAGQIPAIKEREQDRRQTLPRDRNQGEQKSENGHRVAVARPALERITEAARQPFIVPPADLVQARRKHRRDQHEAGDRDGEQIGSRFCEQQQLVAGEREDESVDCSERRCCGGSRASPGAATRAADWSGTWRIVGRLKWRSSPVDDSDSNGRGDDAMVSSLFGTAVTGKKSTPLGETIERFQESRQHRCYPHHNHGYWRDASCRRDTRALHGANSEQSTMHAR